MKASPRWIAVTVYALLLAALSNARPFWVDELLQLFGAKDLALPALLRYVMTFPGAAPFGYLIQHWFIQIFGFSAFSARLPSEVASVLGCIGLFILLRRFGIGNLPVALLAWMLLPLQLRYAVEARPYALGLLFSILATLCFFRILSNPSIWNAAAYCIAVILGIYSAPYTLFLQAGYVAWALAFQTGLIKKLLPTAALAVAGCAFLPWYLASANYWKNYLAVTADVGFRITPKFILLPIQEISGGGYICSISLIALAIFGYRSPRLTWPVQGPLLFGVVSGFACVMIADVAFGYFFAIRQVMFILVPIFIFAAAGFAFLIEGKQWRVAAVPVLALLLGSIVKDVRYFSDRSEDWAAAAGALDAAAAKGACLKFIGADDPRFYSFFVPSLATHACPLTSPSEPVAVPSSRYTQPADLRKTQEDLLKSGYRPESSVIAGGTTVTIYRLH